MFGLILAVPLACVPASPAAADPMNSTREIGAFFATLQIDVPVSEGPPLPMLGARLTAMLQRRFGLEASVEKAYPFVTVAELSAVAVVKLVGNPVLLRAGVSHVPAHQVSEIGFDDGSTGFHAGASLFTGDVDDRVRVRFDYTYRQFDSHERRLSSLGLGLVLSLEPD